MNGRRLWIVALIWVLTVAGASTLTWTVISAAGARVSQPVTVATATATPSETSSEPPADSVRTSSGSGGRVTAHCTEDGAISLGTAVPDDGYWVKMYDPGPVNLRVDFEATAESEDGDNDQDDASERSEVRVTATCVDGTPVFKRT